MLHKYVTTVSKHEKGLEYYINVQLSVQYWKIYSMRAAWHVWIVMFLVTQGSLAGTMREVQPTCFLGVPRVWEKMQEKMVEISKQSGGMKRRMAAWAKDIGLRGNLSMMNG